LEGAKALELVMNFMPASLFESASYIDTIGSKKSEQPSIAPAPPEQGFAKENRQSSGHFGFQV
jgi:hypothetical protein